MRPASPRTLVVSLAAVLVLGCGTPGAVDTPSAEPAETAEQPAEVDAEVDDEVAAEVEEPDDVGAGSPDEANEPSLTLVATVAPVTDLVARVGGDRVEVASLVPPGADSHTYEPRPQDVAILAEADAYLGVGLDLNDGAIDLAQQHLRAGAPVILLGELALDDDMLVHDHVHDADGGHGHSHDADDGHTHDPADGHTHDADDGHTHDADGGHSHDGHSHDADDEGLGPNPHVWTSVRNARALVETVAAELTTLDPDGAEVYAANASDLAVELEDLDAAIATATATVPDGNRTLVTYHDAWSYFARDYGFEFVVAVQPGDFSEPSAAEVREVIDLIRERDVAAVFGSEVFPSRVLDTIAAETAAVYVGDLSDDALPGSPGDPEHSYVELMRRNAATIVDALGGDTGALTP